MKTIVVVLASSLLLRASAADSVKITDKRYVMNIAGAELHDKPSFKAKTLRKIPVGAAVQIQRVIASNDVQLVGTGLALSGDWLQVTAPNYTGYIFSADVTTLKPELKKSRSGLVYITLLGAKKSSREEKGRAAAGSSPGAEHTITEYANSTYTYTEYDGCFDHEYMFRRLVLPEVYHHMVNSYAGYEGQKLIKPRLMARKGNVYTFTCGFGDTNAVQELKLTVNKNGSIVISSYDCT